MIYTYNGHDYNINIIIKKIKNIYLRVDDNLNINITANKYVRKSDIEKLIRENTKKINNMIEINSEKQDKSIVKYLGNKYDIIYIDDGFFIDYENKKIYINNKNQIEKFFDKEIRKLFSSRLDLCYNIMRNDVLCFPNMKIRKMKTRWGVCNSSKETITLNYYLIERNIDEIDYVIVHELSHLVYFDHSKNFWNLVSKYVPNYKEIRKNMR